MSVTKTLCVAGLLAAALVPGTAAPAGANDERADEQGLNDEACTPDPAHPEPVVLVHGGGIEPGVPLGEPTWRNFVPVLEENGYCPFVIEYNWERTMTWQKPGSVDESGGATQLDAFIDEVLASTGAAQVDVVAHSLGAPVTRSFMLGGPGNHLLVDDLVMLGGPNHALDPDSVRPLLKFESVRQAAGEDGGAFMKMINGFVGERETMPGVDYTAIGLDEESWVGNPFIRSTLASVNNTFFGDSIVAINDNGDIPMFPDDPPATHEVDVFEERSFLRSHAYGPRRLCPDEEFHHVSWPNHPVVQSAILETLKLDGPLPGSFRPTC